MTHTWVLAAFHAYQVPMQIGMRQVLSETVELTWTALTCGLYGREEWRGPAGRLCLTSVRRMLPRLADVRLTHRLGFGCVKPRPLPGQADRGCSPDF